MHIILHNNEIVTIKLIGSIVINDFLIALTYIYNFWFSYFIHKIYELLIYDILPFYLLVCYNNDLVDVIVYYNLCYGTAMIY